MNYKELKSKIKQDCNLDVYDNKLLKSLANKVKQSDILISAFECVDNENNMCLVIATKQSMLISTNQFF